MVAELRQATDRAAALVAELTELAEPAVTADTVVVDRPGWVSANTASMSTVMDPLVEKLTASRPVGRSRCQDRRSRHRSAGRCDPGLPVRQGARPVRVLLGRPGPVAAGRSEHRRRRARAPGRPQRLQALGLPARGAPTGCSSPRCPGCASTCWTRSRRCRSRWTSIPDVLRQRLRNAVDRAGQADPWRQRQCRPDRRAVLARVTGGAGSAHRLHVAGRGSRGVRDERRAVLGHPVPARDRAAVRGAPAPRGGNPLDRLLRSLLGLDAKTRQYTQGSQFVRAVVDQVGLAGFNAVWTSSDTLPTKAEITAPADWVRRVHG